MNNFKHNLTEWFRNNIDFALFLAVFTETPRWAVAFMAVNEPLWVGVPLGVLLAFATSHAWRTYFETKNRGLFAFNVVSILIAVAVIAPVLFAMTESEAHEVNISGVLNPALKGVWTTLLALTTFIPLVQLAAVKGLDTVRKEQTKPAPRSVRTVHRAEETEQVTVFEPAQIVQADPVIEQPVAALVDQSDEQKRAYLAELLNSGQMPAKTKLARQLGIGRTTLYTWIQELSGEIA